MLQGDRLGGARERCARFRSSCLDSRLTLIAPANDVHHTRSLIIGAEGMRPYLGFSEEARINAVGRGMAGQSEPQ